MKLYSKKATSQSKSTFNANETLNSLLSDLQKESETILNENLAQKIGQINEICKRDIWNLNRIPEIRKTAEESISNFIKECEELEDEEPSANPLMQLLAGGLGDSKDKEASSTSSLSTTSLSGSKKLKANKKASKLLLNSIKLSEDNKINLKLCLELDTNKSKTSLAGSQGNSQTNLNENVDEPPAKKSKKNSNTEITQNTEDKQDGTEEITEDTKTEEIKEDSKTEEETSKEKKPDPILKCHPQILELINIIKPEIDVLVDWCITLRVWLLSSVKRNQNLGGADLAGECKAVIIEELKGVEDEFASYKEQLSAYFLTKATVLEKVIKTPEFEDLKMFIIDEDEKMFVNCRNIILSLRNQTMSLYDAIEKDSERLFGDNNDSVTGFAMY